MIDIVEHFRSRLDSMQRGSGLKDKPFAESIGLNYHTYRNLMGRDKKRPANQGPSLETIGVLFGQLGISKMLWLLTGEGSPETRTGEEPQPAVAIAEPGAATGIIKDLDNLFNDARQRAEADPEFAVWLKVELKKALE